jgi:hypothetical protein
MQQVCVSEIKCFNQRGLCPSGRQRYLYFDNGLSPELFLVVQYRELTCGLALPKKRAVSYASPLAKTTKRSILRQKSKLSLTIQIAKTVRAAAFTGYFDVDEYFA